LNAASNAPRLADDRAFDGEDQRGTDRFECRNVCGEGPPPFRGAPQVRIINDLMAQMRFEYVSSLGLNNGESHGTRIGLMDARRPDFDYYPDSAVYEFHLIA